MPKLDNPLISIITPCRNSATYIEQTILSVINQSYHNVEYIIVDGGSTDGTLEIIRKYENLIAYWVSEPDDGMYQAINKGLQHANGKYIAYLNSDDLYFTDTIKMIIDFFANNSTIDVVYGNLDFLDEKGRKLFTQIYPDFCWNRFASADHAMIGQPAAFWKASLHNKIGCFDESMKMAADFDFFIRAGMHGKIKHTPIVLAAFRTHSSSLTSRQASQAQDEILLIKKKYNVDKISVFGQILRNLYFIYFKIINYRVMASKLIIKLKKIVNV